MNTFKLEVSQVSLVLVLIMSAASPGNAQLTPTPTPQWFHEWTGAQDSNFLNAANWKYSGWTAEDGPPAGLPSSPTVPDGPTAAIYLPLSPENKVLNFNHEGEGTRRFTFYSIQTGASKAYTLNFSGNPNGWLEVNPLVKGFAPNGGFDTLAQPGYNGASNNNTRIPVYVTLNAYTRLTLDGSYNTILRTQSGLNQALFTLRGNAEMDVSNAGSNTAGRQFVSVDNNNNPVAYTVPNTAIEIGAIQVTEPGTRIYMGTLQVTMQNNLGAGDNSEWGGLVEWDTTTTNSSGQLLSATRTHSFRGAITNMTGRVISPGTFWLRGSETQYVVNGIHDGPIRVGDNNAATLGGKGVVNGAIEVRRGGWINPATRGTATATGEQLTINGDVTLNGGLQFDLVSLSEIDRLTINGNLTIPAITSSTNPILSVFLNEDTFPMGPGEYDLLTVNGTITGNFEPGNVIWSVGPTLSPSWRWLGNTLQVSFEQLPFAGVIASTYPEIDSLYITILDRIDQIDPEQMGLGLLASLNRAKAQYQFEDILYQLTPSAYQAWYPSAVVRTNSMVQTIEDRQMQDAAYSREKGSVQTFLQGYRQESSRDRDELAAYSNYGTIASVAGVDYAISDRLVAGAFVAHEESDFNLDTHGGRSDVKSNTFGLNARYQVGKSQVQLLGFYGTDDYESHRTVAATGVADWSDSDTSGRRIGAAGSVAYTITSPWVEIIPSAGIQWLDWQADGFQETNGNDASLYVYEQQKKSVQSKVGLRLARSFETKHGLIRPFFQYAWMREFYDGTRAIDATLFDGRGGRIGIRAPGIDANAFRIDCGFDWSATRNLRIDIRYTAEDGGAAGESEGVRGGLTYMF